MDKLARLFLIRLLFALVVVVCALSAFNILVDPYELFDSPTWKYLNARKPTSLLTLNERQIKSYEVRRDPLNGVILGTSMVDIGLDATNPAWPGAAQPMYNLGLYGIDVRGSYLYLQYALRQRPLHLVVVGVEFDQFLGRGLAPLEPLERARLGEMSLASRTMEITRAALSFDTTLDSVDTIAVNLFGSQPPSLAGNHPEDEFARSGRLVGLTTVFRVYNVMNMSTTIKNEKLASTVRDVSDILKLCRSHGSRVIFVINPIHADVLETYSLFGFWDDFENWKRAITRTIARAQNEWPSAEVELWDFSGYDKYSTIDPRVSPWFWNPNHYTRRLGDLMVRRLFGEPDAEFGMVLTQNSVEMRLAEIRVQQTKYRQTHPEAVEALRHMYERVMLTSNR